MAFKRFYPFQIIIFRTGFIYLLYDLAVLINLYEIRIRYSFVYFTAKKADCCSANADSNKCTAIIYMRQFLFSFT